MKIVLPLFLLIAGVMYMAMRPNRNVRNHNPLNIRISADNWQGSRGDDGAFVKFAAPEWGFRAAYKTMLTYRSKYGLNTISEIISRWAPSNENHTENYIDYVADKINYPSWLVLPYSKYPQLMLAMAEMEGAKGAYTIEQAEQGIALA